MTAGEPTIESLPDAIGSVVNRLVENEGASFPFLAAAVGLNVSIWCGRVELIDAENGRCSTVAEKLVEGGFAFPINIMVIDSRGKGYLARIGTEDLRPIH